MDVDPKSRARKGEKQAARETSRGADNPSDTAHSEETPAGPQISARILSRKRSYYQSKLSSESDEPESAPKRQRSQTVAHNLAGILPPIQSSQSSLEHSQMEIPQQSSQSHPQAAMTPSSPTMDPLSIPQPQAPGTPFSPLPFSDFTDVDIESDRWTKILREGVEHKKIHQGVVVSRMQLQSLGASSSSAVVTPNDNDDSHDTGDPSKSRFQFVSASSIRLA